MTVEAIIEACRDHVARGGDWINLFRFELRGTSFALEGMTPQRITAEMMLKIGDALGWKSPESGRDTDGIAQLHEVVL